MQVLASVGERRNTKEMEVENVFHMKKGVDHTSYAKNSLMQRTVTSKAGPIIEQSARKVYNSLRPECLMMAEMGCSSGPNALQVVSRIIDVIEEASRSIKRQCPQFGVFLNDLPGNDFNAIFNLLPNFNQDLQEAKEAVSDLVLCRESLNHFMVEFSQTNFFILFTHHTVFTGFPRSRSREIVSDGGMVVVLNGSINSDDPDSILELLGSTLQDMVLEGVIEQEKLDKFNMPFFTPTVEEVRKLVKAEGSFALNKLETFTVDWSVDTSQNLETRAKFVAKSVRAIVEPFLTTAFNHAVMDDLFLLFETRVKERIARKTGEFFTIVLSVTKKE